MSSPSRSFAAARVGGTAPCRPSVLSVAAKLSARALSQGWHAAGDAPGGGALRAGGGGGWHAAIAVMEQAGWRRLARRGEAAFADLKRAGQRAHRKLLTERFHHRETLAGTSADKIPNAFLRSHAAGAGHRSRRAAGATHAPRRSRRRAFLDG